MRHATAVASILIGTAFLGGCVSIDDPSQQFYDENYALWLSTGPASYDFVLTRSCVCTPQNTTVAIQVRNRNVTSRTFQDTGAQVPAGQAANYPDVPGLFLVIRDAISRRPASSTYGYNRDYGYPELIRIDYTFSRTDDDILYSVQSFTAVP